MSEEDAAARMLRYLNGELPDADPGVKAEAELLRALWEELGQLPQPDPSGAMRARFYQKLNAHVTRNAAPASVWRRWLMPQLAAACIVFLVGMGVGRMDKPATPPPEISQLRTQVEDLRQTVALSLMDKQSSASSRLQGIAWSSQVDRPDQELLTALLTTLNHDQNVNVRLAALDALEKFTSDSSVRKALEQSIPRQQSPLMQIALIDSLVHAHDGEAANEFKQLSGNADVNAEVRQRARWGLEKLNFE
jgi:HEAT repeat protein